jgi:hypothetical protein
MCQPCRHSEARDKKSVGHDGATLASEGVAVGLCRLALAQTGVGVELDRCQWAHSASCTTVMVWISANWQYILSTPSMVNGGEVLRGLAAAASVWPPSRLVEGATSLARAWVEAKSTIRILSALSVGLCRGVVCGLATVVTCLPVSLLHHCAHCPS